MKESYVKGLANHNGPESCVEWGDSLGEALTGVRAGWVLSREINSVRDADLLMRCLAVVVFVSLQCWSLLVSLAAPTQPAEAAYLGADASFACSLAALAARPSPLSPAAVGRHYLRQEPDALAAHVRICGGGD